MIKKRVEKRQIRRKSNQKNNLIKVSRKLYYEIIKPNISEKSYKKPKSFFSIYFCEEGQLIVVLFSRNIIYSNLFLRFFSDFHFKMVNPWKSALVLVMSKSLISFSPFFCCCHAIFLRKFCCFLRTFLYFGRKIHTFFCAFSKLF